MRELRNLMELTAVLANGPLVADGFFRAMLSLPPAPDTAQPEEPGNPLPLSAAVEHCERRAILAALAATADNKAAAARRLGISERTLWYKLAKLGL